MNTLDFDEYKAMLNKFDSPLSTLYEVNLFWKKIFLWQEIRPNFQTMIRKEVSLCFIIS